MEFDRRVQVRLYPDSGERPFFGSGYLIAPRLVLTAAHVLGDEASGPDPGSIKVSVPPSDARGSPDLAAGREFLAELRYYRKTQTVDAALVEIKKDDVWIVPESLQDVTTHAPQRWGRLIGTRPHPVSLIGFPRMQQDPGSQDRSSRQLNGHIDPGNQSPDHRYEIFSTDPVRHFFPEAAEGTRWSGISGAAVLAEATEGDLLCGVARHDLKADGGTILTATPVALLLEDSEFRSTITAYSHAWEPV
ncbi:trypsin-like serine peptidase, partial [Streptomyces griseoaurantiacus]